MAFVKLKLVDGKQPVHVNPALVAYYSVGFTEPQQTLIATADGTHMICEGDVSYLLDPAPNRHG